MPKKPDFRSPLYRGTPWGDCRAVYIFWPSVKTGSQNPSLLGQIGDDRPCPKELFVLKTLHS